ncbi:carbohydrate ABC transporter permease [Rossellomorea yichunensis]|jgi:putative chitobiose transport system permease protein|uniref:carbohydrate ABC transporter permease n=1 Tax=Rossellomorea yichunensis TaxID=3077331 RepID=UPI0028DEB1F0|nr:MULTISPECIES: carbohydrate ABC transporter permease [Rossellomorea]MDT9026916.1 carbohydrate ABC transporter permease [Rossellomorea sp. YC4-1]WRP06261.1 carbohydrate ABC transporter permease [Rossellomorea aquimaris]
MSSPSLGTSKENPTVLPSKRPINVKKIAKRALQYGTLLFVTLIMVGPFLWLLATSLKSGSENIFAYPPQFIPEKITFGNYVEVMEFFPFWRYLFNSVVVSVVTVLLNIVFCSLAAYPLARMNFRGKNIVFVLILSTMMVPFQLLMIPIYLLALDLGLQNTYAGLILPHATTAFGIFLMRQAFLTIPYELDESARMDGANAFQIWWRVLMPLVKPSLVTLAIFTFMMAWGDFLWPLIILNDTSMYTLPLGVNTLAGSFSANWRYIAAGSIISILPIIIIFAILQRHFIAGAMKGAVKG